MIRRQIILLVVLLIVGMRMGMNVNVMKQHGGKVVNRVQV
jgi:hypothetical protein